MEVFGRETKLRGFDGNLIDKRTESTDFLGLQQARTGGRKARNIGSTSGNGAYDAFPFEVLESTGNRVRIDPEIGRGAARGWQRIASTENPRGDALLDLLFNLQMNGDARACGYAQKQHHRD